MSRQLKKFGRRETKSAITFTEAFCGITPPAARVSHEELPPLRQPVQVDLGVCQDCGREAALARRRGVELIPSQATVRVFSPTPDGVYIGAICNQCRDRLVRSREPFFDSSSDAKAYARERKLPTCIR